MKVWLIRVGLTVVQNKLNSESLSVWTRNGVFRAK